MKFFTAAVATVGALASAGALTAPTATADAGEVAPRAQPLSTQRPQNGGGIIQGWTVTNLRPNTDVIHCQPRGSLWEATATSAPIQDTVGPMIANLGARSASGQNYPASTSEAAGTTGASGSEGTAPALAGNQATTPPGTAPGPGAGTSNVTGSH